MPAGSASRRRTGVFAGGASSVLPYMPGGGASREATPDAKHLLFSATCCPFRSVMVITPAAANAITARPDDPKRMTAITKTVMMAIRTRLWFTILRWRASLELVAHIYTARFIKRADYMLPQHPRRHPRRHFMRFGQRSPGSPPPRWGRPPFFKGQGAQKSRGAGRPADLLHRPVDLVNKGAPRREIRAAVDEDVVALEKLPGGAQQPVVGGPRGRPRGQVVETTRDSETAGMALYYRRIERGRPEQLL